MTVLAETAELVSTNHVTVSVISVVRWWLVVAAFNDSSISYLLVADYRQQNVYQLQPDTGELRSLFTDNIYTVSLALDPRRKMVYVAYVEPHHSRQYQIRKKSFRGHINSIISYAPSGS